MLGSAIAAIDIALWDIKARRGRAGVRAPWRARARQGGVLLPPGRRAISPASSTWCGQRAEHVGPRDGSSCGGACRPKASCWSRAAPFADRWRSSALREAVGDEIELCFDVHTRLTPPEAILLCARWPSTGPTSSRTRCAPRARRRTTSARAKIDVPLAVGEQFASKWEFPRADRPRPDRLCPHRPVHRRQGLPRGKRSPAGARGTISTSRCTTRWGRWLQRRACISTWPSPTLACRSSRARPGTMLTDVVQNQPVWRDGAMLPNERPAWG